MQDIGHWLLIAHLLRECPSFCFSSRRYGMVNRRQNGAYVTVMFRIEDAGSVLHRKITDWDLFVYIYISIPFATAIFKNMKWLKMHVVFFVWKDGDGSVLAFQRCLPRIKSSLCSFQQVSKVFVGSLLDGAKKSYKMNTFTNRLLKGKIWRWFSNSKMLIYVDCAGSRVFLSRHIGFEWTGCGRCAEEISSWGGSKRAGFEVRLREQVVWNGNFTSTPFAPFVSFYLQESTRGPKKLQNEHFYM